MAAWMQARTAPLGLRNEGPRIGLCTRQLPRKKPNVRLTGSLSDLSDGSCEFLAVHMSGTSEEWCRQQPTLFSAKPKSRSGGPLSWKANPYSALAMASEQSQSDTTALSQLT